MLKRLVGEYQVHLILVCRLGVDQPLGAVQVLALVGCHGSSLRYQASQDNQSYLDIHEST